MAAFYVYTIDDVHNALNELQLEFKEDFNKTCIASAVLSIRELCILRNKKLFRKYDPQYPERILCIMIIPDKPYIVLVKQKMYDMKHFIKFSIFENMFPMKIAELRKQRLECQVCMEKIKTAVIKCTMCNCFLCDKCLGKIQEDEYCWQCPTCRHWMLEGQLFGVPFDTEMYLDIELGTTRRQFGQLLENLDGFIEIIPRKNTTIIADLEIAYCKYPFTKQKYDKNYSTPQCIGKNLEELFKITNEESFTFYLVRQTYAIDPVSNHPINEISFFRWCKDKLVQYEVDAWNLKCITDIFADMKKTWKKVEYMEPNVLEIPKTFIELKDNISRAFPGDKKTISIVGFEKGDIANFDVNERDEIETMATAQIARILDEFTTKNKTFYVTARIIDPERKNVRFVMYTSKKDTATGQIGVFEKMDKKQTKKLFDRDVDGLKRSMFIHTFV